ncbi:MAG: S9 family peptidase [candidate division Zixibacteria bacterium]|nr:S9 family peptidase [candidate division Zixibacteria bacterium]
MRTAVLLIAAAALAVPVSAQQPQPYMMPPKPIADLVDAPLTPTVSLSPDQQWMLLMQQPGLPPIEEVAAPELRLAGLRINPRTNGPSRAGYYTSLTFKRIADGTERPITGLPATPRINSVSWSPDGSRIAFAVTYSDRVELWTAALADAKAAPMASMAMNAAYGGTYDWASDSKTIIALAIPANRGAAPPEMSIPTGPVIQQNLGKKAPARTYQDLLKNQADEAIFTHYATSQIVRLTIGGQPIPLGAPGIFSQATPSPDGKYILVEIVHPPFSYTVPVDRFPRRVEVWDMNGVSVHSLGDFPLADQVPMTFASVRTGPRDYGWRADAAATLYWAEALDGGDAGVAADKRDQLFMLAAPFKSKPTPLATLGLRFGNVQWGNDNLALVSERWWKTRRQHVLLARPGSPSSKPRLLLDYSSEDRYNDPGSAMMRPTDRGTYVLLTGGGGNSIYLSGAGASSEGDRPFIDQFDLKSAKAKRLFRSESPVYERPVRLLDPGKGILLTTRESVSEPPNYYIRNLGGGAPSQITKFPHPVPQLASVQKELIRYKRDDGVDLTATLYLPAGYKPADGPLPMLMWAYPQEFKSADAAGQVTDSPYRFVRIGAHSPLLWLVYGYAVLDNPTMPIVGEGEAEPNDTYVKQLVASAQAAVDEVVRRGVADRDKIAIGGHSYGAFMTANLLAHSDIFRLGIARSGAYNRTLTPFGFQSEERTLWQAPDTYAAMSPFMFADKINEPILLIHGAADNNSGTFPLQSERFYDALKGHGATARFVLLPAESHGYRARESVMHMLYEMTDWLERYVKNAGPRTATGGGAGTGAGGK